MTSHRLIQGLAGATGSLLLLLGIVSNEWMIRRFLIPDANVSLSERVAIAFIEAALLTAGLLVIWLRKNPRKLGNLLLSFFAIALSFALAEMALRALRPEGQRLPFAIENPNGTGSYRGKPNLDLRVVVDGQEMHVKTNSHGMRWREITQEKPRDKRRIAFVGDSFVWGAWATETEGIVAAVFEGSLDPPAYEVLNFGVAGYGLADMKLQIEEQVLPFAPDILIVVFFNGNDFRDTFLGTNKYRVVNGTLVTNSEAFIQNAPDQSSWPGQRTLRRLPYAFRRLAILDYWERVVDRFPRTSAKQSAQLETDFKASSTFDVGSFWSRTHYSPLAAKAKDVSLEVLDQIWQLCQNNGVQLVIATLPFREQVYARLMAGDDYDVNLPQKYVEEFAYKRSIPYLDLLPVLRSHVRENNTHIYLPSDPHLNNEGNRVVGQALARFFKEHILSQLESKANSVP